MEALDPRGPEVLSRRLQTTGRTNRATQTRGYRRLMMLTFCARRSWLIPLLAAAPLAACSDPIDPVNLADQAALHAREIVHQSGGGVSFATRDDSGLRTLGNSVSDSASGVMGAMPAMMPPGMMSAMGTSPMAMAM